MFVFATTEPHKVPRTIISRCQAFDFRRISPQHIAQHLGIIAQSLQVEISGEALSLIAHRANGGMRDALVMLEQVISYGGTTITAEAVLDMLGLADRAVHESFLKAIEASDQGEVMEIIDHLIERGKDLEIFLTDVIALLRDRLRQPSPRMAVDIRLSQRLLDIKADLFRSLDRRIRLEIGVLALMESLSGSPTAGSAGSSKPDSPQQASTVTTISTETPAAELPPSQPPVVERKKSAPQETMPSAAVNSLPAEYKKPWEAMLQEIEQDRIAIAAFLIEGSPSVEGDKLLISFHPDHSFHKDSLEMRDNFPYLAGAVRRHFGDAVHAEITTDDSVSRKPLPHEVLMEKARMVCKAVDGKIVKEDW